MDSLIRKYLLKLIVTYVRQPCIAIFWMIHLGCSRVCSKVYVNPHIILSLGN